MNKLNFRTFLLLMLLCVTAVADDDDDDKKPSTQGQSINLTDKAQKTSGLQTIKLEASSFQVEAVAHGKVLAIQLLFELKQRYLSAIAERDGIRAKARQAQQQMQRQQALYQDGVSAKRSVEEQQVELTNAQAQLKIAQQQNMAVREQAVLTWGTTLTTWALSDSKRLDDLLSGKKKLLQITLNSQYNQDIPKIIHISASGNREQAAIAELISLAPQTDSTQGQSYFFQTTAKNLSVGMNLTAWLPEQTQEKTGVMIPKSALLWVMDQAFVYVKTDNNHYTRRALINYTPSPNGYFVSEGLTPNEELVITGAQMLLSEELRGQIPDED